MSHSSENPWRDALHARFRGQPTPLLVMPDALWTAASLWAGTRSWTKAFRSMELVAGDTVTCALPAGPAFVQVLLACLWEGLTFATHDPGDEAPTRHAVHGVESRLLIGATVIPGVPVLVPDQASQPPALLPRLASQTTATPGIAVRWAGDGQGAAVRWSAVALLDAARSVAEQQRLEGGCVLSIRPWVQSPDVIGEVLGPLLHADELVVAGDRSLPTTLRLALENPVTHLGLDAATADAWRATADGRALLDRLVVRVT